MTIKQLGGVFGRNPTFNDVTIEGELTFEGDIDVNSDLKVNGDLDVVGDITAGNQAFLKTVISEYSMEVGGQYGKMVGTKTGSGVGGLEFYSYSGGLYKTADLTNSGNLNLTTGNLIVSSGAGIDFSATGTGTGTSTSELFDDYEEGTWTPTDASGAGLTLTSYGNYTKIGRTVFWQAYVSYPATANASVAAIGGLPFALVTGANVSGRSGSTITVTTETTTIQSLQIETSDSVRFYKAGFVQNTNSELSGDEIYFSGFYITA